MISALCSVNAYLETITWWISIKSPNSWPLDRARHDHFSIIRCLCKKIDGRIQNVHRDNCVTKLICREFRDLFSFCTNWQHILLWENTYLNYVLLCFFCLNKFNNFHYWNWKTVRKRKKFKKKTKKLNRHNCYNNSPVLLT